ncbi:MAG: histidinol-phosphate transaminase [Candidatus Thorarchaeota archaeon]
MGDISHLLKPHITTGMAYSPTALLRKLYEIRSDYARLMGNELPFGISPKARQAAIEELERAHLYPDSSYYDLKQALAAYTGVADTHIVVGNGSTHFIDAFYHGFLNPGDAVLFVPPDYAPYRLRLGIFGGIAQSVPRPPPDYSWNLDHVFDTITAETKEIILISPNNPVGNCLPERELKRVLNLDLLIVVDEAYFDFADTTFAHLIDEYPNLIITRTMAKAFGFAGLRLGYALTNPKLAEYLSKVLHHFPVNRVTAAAAVAALGDVDYLAFVKEKIQTGREYLEKALNEISGVKAFPSKTNFVLTQYTTPNADSNIIAQQLLQNGIIVRDYTGKAGLVGQFIRITVGTQEQNEACVATIEKAMKHK